MSKELTRSFMCSWTLAVCVYRSVARLKEQGCGRQACHGSNESIEKNILTALVHVNKPTVSFHVLVRTELDVDKILAAGNDGGFGCAPKDEADDSGRENMKGLHFFFFSFFGFWFCGQVLLVAWKGATKCAIGDWAAV